MVPEEGRERGSRAFFVGLGMTFRASSWIIRLEVFAKESLTMFLTVSGLLHSRDIESTHNRKDKASRQFNKRLMSEL